MREIPRQSREDQKKIRTKKEFLRAQGMKEGEGAAKGPSAFPRRAKTIHMAGKGD